ncbi:hypothetical protein DNTS_001104 [Danionella cerebrum]|uniref:Uncharacterized protein n=1 Tax=Danionella cerebrum TaxID=2873325 RepID=A0A553Q973_9TELE|nr:hypothetical protein DNTS_001104 [Danionella translucida]
MLRHMMRRLVLFQGQHQQPTFRALRGTKMKTPRHSPGLALSIWTLSSKPRDFSQPNSSWSPEMRKVYDHYNALCATDPENESEKSPWMKLPSYNRSIKYATGQ